MGKEKRKEEREPERELSLLTPSRIQEVGLGHPVVNKWGTMK